ncbi:hypothetical protein HF072_17190 [Bacillus sp. RO3]|nr:hypothetical protein [Bacillus sp. RO3]
MSLLTAGFSSSVSAHEISKSEEEQILELAEQLEFIFEEASVLDENGNIVDFNYTMIEEQYGSTFARGLEEEVSPIFVADHTDIPLDVPMKQVMTAASVPNKDKIEACFQSKVRKAYKETLSITALNSLYNYAQAKDYTSLSKKLFKIGIKGNVPAIAIQLLLYKGQCTYKYNGWWPKE